MQANWLLKITREVQGHPGYSAQERAERDVVYLTHTGWDDWFKYSTQYNVEYVDLNGERRSIGNTKIGRFGLLPSRAGLDVANGARYPQPPSDFDAMAPMTPHFLLIHVGWVQH